SLGARFPNVIDAAMGGPVALREALESIEGLDPLTRTEVTNFMARLDQVGMFDRIHAAVEFGASWWSAGKGCLLVATGSTAVANELVERLGARVGEQSVRAHCASMSRKDR